MPSQSKRKRTAYQPPPRHKKVPMPLTGIAVLFVAGLLGAWGLFELQRAPYPTGGTLLGGSEISVVWVLMGLIAAIEFGLLAWFVFRIRQRVIGRS